MNSGANKTAVECAYEYAQDGSCGNLSEIRKKLKRDGFSAGQIDDHLHGKTLSQQLTRMCRESQERMADVQS